MIQARYTEVLYNLLKDPKVKQEIDKAMSEYPVYTPENPITFSIIPTREELNKLILDHFKYREIAFETVGRFIDELRITLNEIMPFYYQLYKTEDVMNGLDDIFGNLDVVESFVETNSTTGNASSTSTSSANSQTNDKNVSSDTPQSELSISNMDIDSVSYANNVNWGKANSSSKGTNTGKSETSATGSIEHTLTRKGNQGVNTYAHDMGELRNIFMNITKDILENPRMQELFMLIY